jgi:sarcosine oxidase delta subunit
MKTVLACVLTKKLNYFEVVLPAKRIVCPHCDGEGAELRGGLKGLCLSSEDMKDHDFARSYMRGDYDVACSHCKGARVIDVVDTDSLTPKMLARYVRKLSQDCRDEREAAAERRGAE